MWVHLYVLLCHYVGVWKYEWEQYMHVCVCMQTRLQSLRDVVFTLWISVQRFHSSIYILYQNADLYSITQLFILAYLGARICGFESIIHSMYSAASIISNRCNRHICWNDPQPSGKWVFIRIDLQKNMWYFHCSWEYQNRPYIAHPIYQSLQGCACFKEIHSAPIPLHQEIPTSKRCIVVSTVGTRMLKNGTYPAARRERPGVTFEKLQERHHSNGIFGSLRN